MNTQKSYTLEEAMRRMERYCSYQERCHKEVRQKLYEMRMIPESCDVIISHLIEHNFLNEGRFAQTFARGKFRTKSWGKIRIIRELKQRDISKYNIDLALKEISDSDYYKTFDQLAEKRFKQLHSEKKLLNKKKKFLDYLSYRGWETEMIYEKMNELF